MPRGTSYCQPVGTPSIGSAPFDTTERQIKKDREQVPVPTKKI